MALLNSLVWEEYITQKTKKYAWKYISFLKVGTFEAFLTYLDMSHIGVSVAKFGEIWTSDFPNLSSMLSSTLCFTLAYLQKWICEKANNSYLIINSCWQGAGPPDSPSMCTSEEVALVDIPNGIIELSCMIIPLTIWHLWPKDSFFAFNCYCHKAILVVFIPQRNTSPFAGTLWHLSSTPLDIFLYSVELVLLAEILQHKYLEVIQPLY